MTNKEKLQRLLKGDVSVLQKYPRRITREEDGTCVIEYEDSTYEEEKVTMTKEDSQYIREGIKVTIGDKPVTLLPRKGIWWIGDNNYYFY